MATQVQIGQAGERIVAAWLSAKGYRTNVDTKAPGSTDIEANGSNTALLVQVKTAVSPAAAATLSADELRNIKSRAAKLGWEAWEARVHLDANLRPAGEILWRKL